MITLEKFFRMPFETILLFPKIHDYAIVANDASASNIGIKRECRKHYEFFARPFIHVHILFSRVYARNHKSHNQYELLVNFQWTLDL